MRRLAAITLPLLALAGIASAQFVPTTTPAKDGVRATADLPTSQHKRNVGGSDGAGLCVYTSAWHAALWQDERTLFDFRAWMQRRPGGSYPEKFDATLKAYCAEKGVAVPAYVQHTGGDVEFLRLALRTGRMPCVTYCGVDGQAGYGSEVIAHMVNVCHLDGERAAVLDNNFPGRWLWMTEAQFIERWKGVRADGSPYRIRGTPVGGGWAIVLLASPPTPYPSAPAIQFGAAPPCICGDGCRCKPGDCPNKCPVSVGQCANGRCPVPATPADPTGPTDPTDPTDLPAATAPPGVRDPYPGENFAWRYVPGLGNRWIQTDTGSAWGKDANGKWGWVQKPKVAEAASPQTADPFPGGVVSDRIDPAPCYSINGQRCSQIEAIAALARSLTDDSNRWHLAAVGDSSFVSKVRADVDKLPADLREKLHVQTYPLDGWQVSQFRLTPGVTLRKPAVGRVGVDVGAVPVADYSAVRLGSLLASVGGPAPAPPPPPEPPKPVEPVKPTVPDPMPPPAPGGGGILWAILAALALLIWKRKV